MVNVRRRRSFNLFWIFLGIVFFCVLPPLILATSFHSFVLAMSLYMPSNEQLNELHSFRFAFVRALAKRKNRFHLFITSRRLIFICCLSTLNWIISHTAACVCVRCSSPFAQPKLTAFRRCTMCTVLSTETGDHLIVAGVATQRERHFDYVIALLHKHQDSFDFLLALLQAGAFHFFDQLVFGNLTSPMEEILDHVEKSRICLHSDWAKIHQSPMGTSPKLKKKIKKKLLPCAVATPARRSGILWSA